MKELFRYVLFGNSVFDYVVTVGILVALLLLFIVTRKVMLLRLKRWSAATAQTLDDFVVSQIERMILPMLFLAAAYTALLYLSFSVTVEGVIRTVFIVLMTFYTARFLAAGANYAMSAYWDQRKTDSDIQNIKGLSGFVSVLIWGVSVIFLLDNLGFKVSTIVAGLGIGGIAVALAAQTILGDLFSYFVIFFDRPFRVGDFIVVDDKVGAVEYIGIKTTRIRSLSGEELVFSNKDLTDSRIHNFKKMERRRVVFTLGVTYQTPIALVREIPIILKEIIVEQTNATFDRAHFMSYGSYSLNFEVVYYVTGADYNEYMDIQQNINLKIFEEFAERKIEFAYPTQTLLVNREE